MNIGYKLSKAEKNTKKYTEMAIWCNSNNATIEDKGEYYEVVAVVIPEPTIEEQVVRLEREYGMNRWQREGILAEGSLYSEYTKNKAQEIETLAENLRGGKNGRNIK